MRTWLPLKSRKRQKETLTFIADHNQIKSQLTDILVADQTSRGLKTPCDKNVERARDLRSGIKTFQESNLNQIA